MLPKEYVLCKKDYEQEGGLVGGNAITDFTCTNVGIDAGTFIFTGTSEPLVENCYGIAIRWANEGEKGQRSITKMEEIPTVELSEQ